MTAYLIGLAASTIAGALIYGLGYLNGRHERRRNRRTTGRRTP